MAQDLSFPDFLAINNVAHQWASSYDAKDWDRLRKITAPSMRLDIRPLGGVLHEELTPDDYIAIMSDKKMLGEKNHLTQHLLGAGYWEPQTGGTVRVTWPIHVVHQRYADDTLATVTNKGHALGRVEHWYKKVEGTWKLCGAKANVDFTEFDFAGTMRPKQ